MAVWPFIPQQGPREILLGSTNVIRTYSAEQRISHSNVLRQAFEFEYLLDDQQFARARALAYGSGSALFDLPVWTEYLSIGTWPSGQQTLEIDADNADFRIGGTALLIQDDATWQVVDVVDGGGGAVDVDAGSPTSIAYSPAYIVPLRSAYMTGGLDVQRSHPTISRARIGWAVVDNIDHAAASDFDSYRSYPVLTDRSVVVGDLSELVERRLLIVDNGLSQPYLDTEHSTALQSATLAWDVQTRAALWRVREWLHTCRMRQKAFWLPTWNTDFVLTADISSSDTVLHVESTGYADNYTLRHLMILHTDGSRTYLRATAGASETGGEVLTLSAAVGANILASAVDRICLMHLSRFAADRVEIAHRPGGASIVIPIDEVPTT